MHHVRAVAVGIPSSEAATRIRASNIKPALRGVPDVVATVLAVPAAALLIAFAASGAARLAGLVYGIGLVLLFATSATYHTPLWPRSVRTVMRTLDHSAIYVLIAASYTPPCLLVLPSPYGAGVLAIVWTAAGLGLLKSFTWPKAPRWLNTAVYILLGWAIVPLAPDMVHGLGLLSSLLIAAGGVLYTVGAVVYVRRWPDPRPTLFGYHELFHVFVIGAAACHYVAMWRLVT
jgi:hemolysin III